MLDHHAHSGRRGAERVALGSLIAALVLVIAKVIAGVASGSLAILSEAAHSGLDAAATALAFVAIRIASRPPDAEHPYGHGKAENIFALLETAALLALSIFIAYEATLRIREGSEVDATWYAFAVIILSIVVDLSRSRVLSRAGKRYRSAALQADALHFTADLLTSSVVLIGLVLVRLGYPAADAWGGLVVAFFVALLSIRLGRRAVDVLMDRAPTGTQAQLEKAVEAVEGVSQVRRLRVRHSGGDVKADVVIAMSRTVPLELAHDVTEKVESAIRSVQPGADVVVHVEPLADERLVTEKVIAIAAREPRASQIHNVHVTLQPDGLHITLHAKFPDRMPLGDAHEISEKLEADIATEIPRIARIDTHIEPLQSDRSQGADVTAEQSTLVAWARALATEQPEVEDCHEVLVTETLEGLSVVMHCSAAPEMGVADIHKVSTLIENEIHSRWPEVDRVTVHFEPASAMEQQP